jgi:hypothetical protein
MEASTVTLRGEHVDRFADEFVEAKADEYRRSIDRRGIRNVHRYEGAGVTQVTYEEAAAYEESWVMVSVLVELVDDRTATVVVFVGGGGEGPFKREDLSMTRALVGEESYGESGRFGTVVSDVEEVCASLELEITAA